MNYFESIRHDVQSQFPLLSPVIHQIVNSFCKLHIYASDWKFGKNFSQLSLDHQIELFVFSSGVHFIGDYSKQMDASIYLLLSLKCAVDLTAQYRSLNKAYQDLWSALRQDFPKSNSFMKIEQDFSENHLIQNNLKIIALKDNVIKLCFFSQYSWLKVQIIIISLTIYTISIKIFAFIYQIIITSLSLRDVYLILKQDSRSRFLGCTDLFVNSKKYKQELEGNCERVYELVLEKAVLVDELLKKVGMIHVNAQLISSNLEVLGRQLKKQYSIASEEGSEIFSNLLFSEAIPNWQIPLPDFSFFNQEQDSLIDPIWQGEPVDLTKISRPKKLQIHSEKTSKDNFSKRLLSMFVNVNSDF